MLPCINLILYLNPCVTYSYDRRRRLTPEEEEREEHRYLSHQAEISKVLAEYEDSAYRKLGVGSGRAVFQLDHDWVVKVPRNQQGESWNLKEAELYKRYGKRGPIPYAECHIVMDANVALLKMETVKPVPQHLGGLPEWTAKVEGRQVGWTKDHELVAFDFGN